MIDEIDYFPKRERHNKKKKIDSGWSDLKKQKNKQDAPPSSHIKEKNPNEKTGKLAKTYWIMCIIYQINNSFIFIFSTLYSFYQSF